MAEKNQEQPEPTGEPQVQEVEVNISLLNNKLNYIIGQIEEVSARINKLEKKL